MLPQEIEVKGRSIQSVLHPLKTEVPEVAQVHKNITIIEGRGCSGCTVTNCMALSFYSPEAAESLGRVTLVVGDTTSKDYRGEGQCFFIGNCAIRSNKGKDGVRIGGCPPPGVWIRRSINEAGKEK